MRYQGKLAAVVAAAMFSVFALGTVSAFPRQGIGSFTGGLDNISTVATTVPANGDVNPYGVAVIHRTSGKLKRGNVLVSNFNNSQNQQGTGTTIIQIAPDGTAGLFAQLDPDLAPGCTGGIGLTTALVTLRTGWVVVGSLPTSDGTAATAKAGCLLVLNNSGSVVETIHGEMINGPWDMTAVEGDGWAVLFVTNVLNGTVAAGGRAVNEGSVVRIRLSVDEEEAPRVLSETVIGSEFPERTDPAALVIGPTGLGLAPDGTLYVADTLGNRIAAIPHALSRDSSAGTGATVSAGGALNGPLGLALTPGSHILTVNGGDGNLVETTPGGVQVDVKPIDTTGVGAGTLFGLAVSLGPRGVYFVNDGDNTLRFLRR